MSSPIEDRLASLVSAVRTCASEYARYLASVPRESGSELVAEWLNDMSRMRSPIERTVHLASLAVASYCVATSPPPEIWRPEALRETAVKAWVDCERMAWSWRMAYEFLVASGLSRDLRAVRSDMRQLAGLYGVEYPPLRIRADDGHGHRRGEGENSPNLGEK